jgi:2-oxoisovalerate dehydrogenase E1 component
MPISESSDVDTATRVFSPIIEAARDVAERGNNGAHRFLSSAANRPRIETALRIKAVEEALYHAFGQGKLHGTIHTCIGQEFSGALLGSYLQEQDFVTSNHRCHGHFIGATGDWRGLIDEIVGNGDGVCAGIGSSQHLWASNFLSNGQQGGLLPVAAGIALDRKLKGGADAIVSFMGEGTLGEGIVYETLNLDSLWSLPHLIICENNFYSQSTPQGLSVSGSIQERSMAFGVDTFSADTWDLENFDQVLKQVMHRVRNESRPAFLLLATYRLNPHSKGDDIRDREEVDWFREHDPATIAIQDYSEFRSTFGEYKQEVAEAVREAFEKPSRCIQTYFDTQLPSFGQSADTWRIEPAPHSDTARLAQQLNRFYRNWMADIPSTVFLGEDIADPYGGAFKISKGLSNEFGDRVVTSPISEAALSGVGIGLANTGRRALVEIMFGDFITYAFDQIINNASKMFHMYNQQFSCAVVIRTPMGGRRGYGPTHSQSLERFLIGVDNCCTVSLNSLVGVETQLAGLTTLQCPVVLLENKADYTMRTFAPSPEFDVRTNGSLIPTVRVAPIDDRPTVTILAYGGIARYVADQLIEIFERTDCKPELIVPVSISPLDLQPILTAVRATQRLLIVEEGSSFGSVGAEVISQLSEQLGVPFKVKRLGGKPTPIPSAPALEVASLPSTEDVCEALVRLSEDTPTAPLRVTQGTDNMKKESLCQ